ncbi:META domain-containing protein [Subtercola endophyticus]|uniref:META domain-containing protein n=1 Tax=Subtercola endophyticus TaxID=2895559 RepID=UPI001E2E16E5|nr:META domain-containing protein [Subtercola endophyticus]UFS58862.1 META domain-containing protein [Subtercola endophyticus]
MARLTPFAILAAAAAVAIVLTGCSAETEPLTPPASQAADAAVEAGFQQGQLVGVWTVQEKYDSPEQPFVAFVQDNTWIASDGCNRVEGTWTVNAAGVMTTTAGPSTMMACEGAQIPLSVTLADHVAVNGDYLTIDSSNGTTSTTLVRSTDPTVGPQGWPIGYWTETRTPTSPFLSISADRTFSGNDGCNVMGGSWAPGSGGSQSVTFSKVTSTMMFCEGVDTWLSRAASATVQGSVMTVSAADGTVLGQLKDM